MRYWVRTLRRQEARTARGFVGPGAPISPAMPRSLGERGAARLPANYPGEFFGGPAQQESVVDPTALGYPGVEEPRQGFGPGSSRESAPQMWTPGPGVSRESAPQIGLTQAQYDGLTAPFENIFGKKGTLRGNQQLSEFGPGPCQYTQGELGERAEKLGITPWNTGDFRVQAPSPADHVGGKPIAEGKAGTIKHWVFAFKTDKGVFFVDDPQIHLAEWAEDVAAPEMQFDEEGVPERPWNDEYLSGKFDSVRVRSLKDLFEPKIYPMTREGLAEAYGEENAEDNLPNTLKKFNKPPKPEQGTFDFGRESAPQMSPFAREVLQGEEHSKYTAWQRFLEKAANRYLPLTDWERRLEAKGIEIPRHMRIALKQAMKRGELSQEQSVIERKFFRPLQDAILNRGKKKLGHKRKMSFKDAEDIAKNKAATEKHDALTPRQGEERSPQLRSKPAWITPREAEAAIAKYERKYGKEHVDAVEKAIMDISAETRRIWRRAELVPSGLIDFLEKSYPHYVPYSEQEMFELEPWKNAYDQEAIQEGGVARSMRNFLEALGSDGMFGEERGSDMRQPMFRTMLGMTKAPEDSSLLMLMGQLNQALSKELDAKISRAVVDLIELGQEHGIGNIATIVPEEKQTRWGAVERAPEEGEEKRVMATEVRDLSFKENPLVYVAAGPDGTRQVIEFHPKFQQIADALKNENMPGFQKLAALEFMGRMTRFIGGMITRWNPAFSVPNFVRDTATASAHITAEYGPKVASEMFLNRSMLSSLKTLWKANHAISNGTYDPDLPEFANDPDMVMFERYKASGAPVTFLDLGKTRGLEDWFREVHQANNPPQIHQVQFWKGHVSTLKGFIENFNDGFENAARFAFFKYGLEKGVPSRLVEGENMDEQELALAAKSLTVNFEAKGTIGGSMNGLFMFFNANIQSNARLIEAIFSRDKKGNRSFQPYAKQLIGSIITLHAAIAVMNAAIGGEDPEDDEKYWAKIPDWDKRANLILMNWMGQDGKAIKVPLPYGYNFFAAIGNMFGEVWSGTKRGEDVAPYLFETGLQAFSPVGGGTDITDMVTPTVAKPLFEIRNNRDWKGSAIYKDRYGDETIPDSELAFDSVNKSVQEFTTWLNEATGGNRHRAGEIMGIDTSINPATIEHFAQFLGGGIGKELFRMFKIKEKISEEEEVEIGDIPLLRRFALSPTKYAAASLYRDRRDQIVQVERMWRSREELSEADRRLLRLSRAKRSAESSIKKIRQQRRLYERGSEEYKKQEERERSVQNAFNKRWNKVMSS